MKIRVNGSVVSFATNCTISRDMWNGKNKRAKGSTSNSQYVNSRLEALEHQVVSIAYSIEAKGDIVSADAIKSILQGTEQGKVYTVMDALQSYNDMIRINLGTKYTKSTQVKYHLTAKRVHEFITSVYKLKAFKLSDLDDSFLMDFETFLRTTHQNDQTTIAKHIQRFRCTIHYAKRRKMIKAIPFEEYSIRPKQREIDFLTQAEIDLIRNTDFNSQSLNHVRDLFIFQCYTGIAYMELYNLSSKNIVVGYDSEYWLRLQRQKTQREYSLPLLNIPLDILKKNSFETKKDKSNILHIMSNQKYNAMLKKIQSRCGIHTKITSHLARRTFACTILLLNQVSLEIVSQSLGHANVGITSKSYAKVIPEMMKKSFDKLKSIIP
jgi:site-specific recombinase XerD